MRREFVAWLSVWVLVVVGHAAAGWLFGYAHMPNSLMLVALSSLGYIGILGPIARLGTLNAAPTNRPAFVLMGLFVALPGALILFYLLPSEGVALAAAGVTILLGGISGLVFQMVRFPRHNE